MKIRSIPPFIFYMVFVVTYTFIFVLTIFILMQYENQWDRTNKDAIWAFTSMTQKEKIAYVLMQIINFPLGTIHFLVSGVIGNFLLNCILNPLLVCWVFIKIFRIRT